MNKLAWILALPLVICSLGRAQSSAPAPTPPDSGQQERMFFPRDMFWDGDNSTWLRRTTKSTLAFAPAMPASMAESTLPAACSPAICSLECLRSVPLAAANCGASWSLAHPRSCSGRPSHKLFIPGLPTPSASSTPGEWESISRRASNFASRSTSSFDRLGARDTNLGPADQGNNGPWGRYASVGVRKYFGTRRW